MREIVELSHTDTIEGKLENLGRLLTDSARSLLPREVVQKMEEEGEHISACFLEEMAGVSKANSYGHQLQAWADRENMVVPPVYYFMKDEQGPFLKIWTRRGASVVPLTD